MNGSKEQRFIPAPNLEFRMEGEERVISGHCPRWGEISNELWVDYRTDLPVHERFLAGAFTECLQKDDVLSLFNHQRDQILGRSSAGTAQYREDQTGLWFEVRLPNTTTGNDLVTLLQRRDVQGTSFSFSVEDDQWDAEEGRIIRTVRKCSMLYDAGSPVVSPAYNTEIALRSLEEHHPLPQDRLDFRYKELELAEKTI